MANRRNSGRMLLEVGGGVALCLLSAAVLTHGSLGLPGAPALAEAGPVPQYDLSVLKTDTPDPVPAGNQITYSIDVGLTGTIPDGYEVIMTDTVPTNTTFASLTPPAGYSCSTPAVGGTGPISCTATPPNGAGTFTMVVDVPASVANGTIISNTANVTTQQLNGSLVVGEPGVETQANDETPGNDSSTATTLVITQAHLVFTKTASPDIVFPYTLVKYTLTVTNTGPSDAQNVKITDTLPAASGFIGATPSAGGVCTTPAVGTSGVVECTFAGATPPNGVHSVEIEVRACQTSTACGEITNQGSASSSTTDPQPDQDSETVVTEVRSLPVPVMSAAGLAFGVLLLFGVAVLTLYRRRPGQR